jgi:hypothetical protein
MMENGPALYVKQSIRTLRRIAVNMTDRAYLRFSAGEPQLRMPDFAIIGAMKAGTTTLHDCLAQHPDVFMTYVKEPSIFMKESPWLEQNTFIGTQERLLQLMMRGYKNQRLVGESSTTYTEAPSVGSEVPQNFLKKCPDMRFIYIVRNPLARIVSHYLHCVGLGIYAESMDEVLAHDRTFLERSLYFTQLSRYLTLFPREQFLVLLFEEFVRDPAGSLREICQFLGVDEGPISRMHLQQSNRTLVPAAVRVQNSQFSSADYARLMGAIADDVAQLEAFLGRSLSCWDLSEDRWCRATGDEAAGMDTPSRDQVSR